MSRQGSFGEGKWKTRAAPMGRSPARPTMIGAGGAPARAKSERARIQSWPTNMPKLVRTRNFVNCRRVT